MIDNKIDIAAVQETRTPNDTREVRKRYTWFYSGSNRTLEGYTDGAAIVIKNEGMQNIEDIEPINDSAIYIKLKSHRPITIIGVHIPQAEISTEDKDRIYTAIQHIVTANKGKGPVLVMGDLNAMIKKAKTEKKHTI